MQKTIYGSASASDGDSRVPESPARCDAAGAAPGPAPPATLAGGTDVRAQPAANAGMNANTINTRFNMRGTILDSTARDQSSPTTSCVAWPAARDDGTVATF
jgi:hypothetical protein